MRHYLGIALALGLRPSDLDKVSAPEKDVSGSRAPLPPRHARVAAITPCSARSDL